jgi:hypothetical protein
MLHVKQDSRHSAGIALIHKDRAAAKQIAVTIEREVKRSVQERMSRAEKCSKRLALRRNQIFLERNTLVPWLDSLAGSNQPVAVANCTRNVRYLVTPRLALSSDTAEDLEGFEEKRFDVVRLEPLGIGALHILPHTGDAASIHRVMGKSTLL